MSDRYAVYLYIDASKLQLGLVHVLRDFVALGERDGTPGRLGRMLERRLASAFKIVNQPGRDRADLALSKPTSLLEQGARGRSRSFSRDAAATCRPPVRHRTPGTLRLLWTFTRIGVFRPRNNTAERALRYAVTWRKTSHGTQTDHGTRAVERLVPIASHAACNTAASMPISPTRSPPINTGSRS